MTDPVQRELSLLEWIRTNKLEASRRLVIWSILGGVLLYIYGEILSRDWALQIGIWMLLAAIVGASIYKLVTFVAGLTSK